MDADVPAMAAAAGFAQCRGLILEVAPDALDCSPVPEPGASATSSASLAPVMRSPVS